MHTRLVMQKDGENTLFSNIVAAFERKPKKVYFFCGTLKEGGFRIIEDELIEKKYNLVFFVGVDKKNTTRGMLEDMLKYSKNVYYYINNSTIEYDANVAIFEYENEALIYLSSSNVSESGFKENVSFYTEIIFEFKNDTEKDEYKKQIKNIMLEINKFEKLDKVVIENLVNDKEIFTTRQYNHNVKSIAELLGKSPEIKEDKKDMTKREIDDVYVENVEIPKIDLSDMSIDIDDIDLSDVEEQFNDAYEVKVQQDKDRKELDIEYNDDEYEETLINDDIYDEVDKINELYDEELEDIEFDEKGILDINDMLFKKADVALEVDSKSKNKNSKKDESNVIKDEKVEDVIQTKKLNLNNVTNYIFELPDKPTKGNDVNSLKIPNYINKMIPNFFEIVDKARNVEVNGVIYKERDVKVEVVDVKNNIKLTDRNAKIVLKSGQTNLTFTTSCLENIKYGENDIARIIKLASDIYHIEIISKDMQEYKLWGKLCTQNFKSTTRRYGMM